MSDREQNSDGEFQTLLDFLYATPTNLAELTAGLSAAELRLKGSHGEFSALESICHLQDLELQGYRSRIKRILDETDPPLADFDGARVAAESNYHIQQVEAALQSFASTRRENVETLRSLTEEQLRREGTLAGVGRITLKQLAEMMREHDGGHLEDLRVLQQRLDRRGRFDGPAGASPPSQP